MSINTLVYGMREFVTRAFGMRLVIAFKLSMSSKATAQFRSLTLNVSLDNQLLRPQQIPPELFAIMVLVNAMSASIT